VHSFRKRAIGVAVVVGLVATVATSVATARPHKGNALPSGTYKIGYVESITGRLAFYEPPWGDGVRTAIDQLNAKGGVGGKLKLQLIAEDGKSDPAAGAVVARDLVSKGVQFGVTPCDQDIGLPAAQVFQKAKIPVVMSCGSGWTFPEVVGDYAFINVFGTAAMGAAQ
jgi:branched-chain amino acid transport system substrate-binding protein